MILKRHKISDVVDLQLSEIEKRKLGIIKPIYVKSKKFMAATGGAEWGNIISIAAQSGGGKTALMIQWEDEFIELNKEIPIEVLTFSGEMLCKNIITRKQASFVNLSTMEINSKGSKPLDDEQFRNIVQVSNEIKKKNITYVNDMGSINDIKETIWSHRSELIKKYGGLDKFGLVIMYDHTLLTKDEGKQEEREKLINLLMLFNEEKKRGNTLIVPLSQTNRSLDNMERLNNIKLQYPNKADIFGSDAVYQFSDILMVLMTPHRYNIPVWGNDMATKDKLYIHILKNRESQPCILIMRDNLKYNKIEDYE